MGEGMRRGGGSLLGRHNNVQNASILTPQPPTPCMPGMCRKASDARQECQAVVQQLAVPHANRCATREGRMCARISGQCGRKHVQWLSALTTFAKSQ